MHLLAQSPFLKALGWALLNSLWQYGLLWLLVMMLVNTRKKMAPAVKHGVSLVTMLAGFAWFLYDLAVTYFAYSNASQVPGYNYPLQFLPVYHAVYASVQHFLEYTLSYFSLLYLGTVILLFIRFTGYFHQLHFLQTAGVQKLNAGLRLYVEQMAQQLSISRKVRVWLSEHVDTPMIMGFLRPTILVPVASINQLTVHQLEAILLHELVHIKRNDYLINVCIASVEIIFFFNPFVKFLVGTIKQEREKCCDDRVLQFRFDPFEYASALFTLEKYRSVTISASLAATGGNNSFLLRRIGRIMGVPTKPVSDGFRPLAYCCAILLLAFIAVVNPAEIVVENISPQLVSIHAGRASWRKAFERRPYVNYPGPLGKERTPGLSAIPANITPPPVADVGDEPLAGANGDEHPLVRNVSLSSAESATEENINKAYAALDVVQSEARDFSIEDPQEPAIPSVPALPIMPFVPAQSFSFSVAADTAGKPPRLETYSEHKAREAMVKAQKALDQIDWTNIEKQLKNSKGDIAEIKKQIEASLRKVNWQQINQQVNDSLSVENNLRMRLNLRNDYDSMKVYKDRQQQYELLQENLKRQEQQYKMDSERKLLELQDQLGKQKVTVHI